MNISSRFAVAVHVLAVLDEFKDEHTTSEFIAGSVNTNPVVIRRILSSLSNAGLIHVQPGVGGASLIKPLDQITLLAIYQAVSVVGEGELFSIHNQPNPACPVGGNIQFVLERMLGNVQRVMEKALAVITLRDVMDEIHSRQQLRR